MSGPRSPRSNAAPGTEVSPHGRPHATQGQCSSQTAGKAQLRARAVILILRRINQATHFELKQLASYQEFKFNQKKKKETGDQQWHRSHG